MRQEGITWRELLGTTCLSCPVNCPWLGFDPTAINLYCMIGGRLSVPMKEIYQDEEEA